jgi:hypothetical protein
MPASPRNVLIVRLAGVDDIEGVMKRISEISGVTDTDYSYLTQKLQVRYEGDQARLRKIALEIKKVLRSASARGRRSG